MLHFSSILYTHNIYYYYIHLSANHTNKSGDTKKDIYADSRFEMICKHDDPDGTSNKAICDRLCSMCEGGGESCIAEHLGCDLSGWAVNDQGSFLRGEGKEVLGCCENPPC